MRSVPLIVLLLATAALPWVPSASAVGPCTLTITPTSVSPTGESASPLYISVRFHMSGPGYTNSCDTAWVNTCQLLVDGAPTGATCTSEGPGAPNCVPTYCDLDLTGTAAVGKGVHHIEATLGMYSGCCGYLPGGPEDFGTASWDVWVYDELSTPGSVTVVVPIVSTPVATIGPIPITQPLPVVVSLRYVADHAGGAGVGTYGPVTKVISTPVADIPVVLCPSTCPYPTSDITITLFLRPYVNGQPLADPIAKEIVVVVPQP